MRILGKRGGRRHSAHRKGILMAGCVTVLNSLNCNIKMYTRVCLINCTSA